MASEILAAWLLTIALHASALIGVAWLFDRGALRSRPAWREMLWRAAFYGGVVTASVQTDRANLAEVLKLVGEILREPAFPADEFEKLKQESLAGLEQQKTDPQALAGNLFARISRPPYAADDPRYTRTFAEEAAAIEAVTLDQLKAFYTSFYGAHIGIDPEQAAQHAKH